MRIVEIPESLPAEFAALATLSTRENKKTCGVLLGAEDKDTNKIVVQFLYLPQQSGTADACETKEDGDRAMLRFAVQKDVLIVGWIHVSVVDASVETA